jgi:hypothetical protein
MPIPHTPTPLHEDGVPAPHRMRGAFEVSMAVFHQLEESQQDRMRRAAKSPQVAFPFKPLSAVVSNFRNTPGYFELPTQSQRVPQTLPNGLTSTWWKTPRTPLGSKPNVPMRARSNSLHSLSPYSCAMESLAAMECPMPTPNTKCTSQSQFHTRVPTDAPPMIATARLPTSKLCYEAFESLNEVNRAANTLPSPTASKPLLSETPFMEELRIQDSKLIQRRRKL